MDLDLFIDGNISSSVDSGHVRYTSVGTKKRDKIMSMGHMDLTKQIEMFLGSRFTFSSILH